MFHIHDWGNQCLEKNPLKMDEKSMKAECDYRGILCHSGLLFDHSLQEAACNSIMHHCKLVRNTPV
jgi:hypothetical protein